jgi:hypothetical protein
MNRETVLDQAKAYVTRDRQNDHGKPEDTFGLIADLWNAYLFGGPKELVSGITHTDVAMMMALLKIARQRQNPAHEDNYVDLAGYAACAAELQATTWHIHLNDLRIEPKKETPEE